MANHVLTATQHLLRYLNQRQEAGQERAFLTDEAKASLRALYFHARSGAKLSPHTTETPRPVATNTTTAESVSSTSSTTPPSSSPEAHAEPQEDTEPLYPKAPVAKPRAVITPRGADKQAQLADLKQRITQDEEVHLPTLRDTMVFSVGNLDAEIMFVGEAPGNEEERQREPFVGPAGQLLTKIIQAMGLQRESVYISNIVKFRPAMPNQGTGNRKPTPEEMQACLPYIMAEIEIVKPRVLIAAGGTAAEGLTGTSAPVGRSRGQVRSWNGHPFLVTYHPSYLLHNKAPSERRKVWEDMLLAMEVLQMPISEKQRQFFSKSR